MNKLLVYRERNSFFPHIEQPLLCGEYKQSIFSYYYLHILPFLMSARKEVIYFNKQKKKTIVQSLLLLANLQISYYNQQPVECFISCISAHFSVLHRFSPLISNKTRLNEKFK